MSDANSTATSGSPSAWRSWLAAAGLLLLSVLVGLAGIYGARSSWLAELVIRESSRVETVTLSPPGHDGPRDRVTITRGGYTIFARLRPDPPDMAVPAHIPGVYWQGMLLRPLSAGEIELLVNFGESQGCWVSDGGERVVLLAYTQQVDLDEPDRLRPARVLAHVLSFDGTRGVWRSADGPGGTELSLRVRFSPRCQTLDLPAHDHAPARRICLVSGRVTSPGSAPLGFAERWSWSVGASAIVLMAGGLWLGRSARAGMDLPGMKVLVVLGVAVAAGGVIWVA